MILIKPDPVNANNLKVLNLGQAGYFVGKPDSNGKVKP